MTATRPCWSSRSEAPATALIAYSVHVANATVRYNGDAKGVNLAGTVTPSGQVSVSIRLRDMAAEGSGRLSVNAGIGRWHGNGPNSTTCAGTWEAERC
jgi:hypothetical protein